MQHAGVEQKIAAIAKRSGLELPSKIKEAPHLRIGLAYYLDAFWKLHTERQIGFGVGFIPHSVIKRYDKSEEFYYIISRMDMEYVHHASSNEAVSAKSTNRR